MKFTILILLMFIVLDSKAQVFKCKSSKGFTFSDKPCKESETAEKSSLLIPHYVKFKYGGTACKDVRLLKQAIELLESKDPQPFLHVDAKCKFLRENTFVLGILKKQKYKKTEFAQVKASNGILYWIELPGLLPITEKKTQRPPYWKTDLRNFD